MAGLHCYDHHQELDRRAEEDWAIEEECWKLCPTGAVATEMAVIQV